ncbi:hypothetical protein ACFFIX_04540 [Metabacillus herbersteinensis]|uniref:GapA-binding peptide SR1P n=1 Tax=Metabacillus herbersteinensis TaxID=283816 RepID=A0ABV6GB56_9BACI
MRKIPSVICPNCLEQQSLEQTLTAQSNQNVIFTCLYCEEKIKNIITSKG